MKSVLLNASPRVLSRRAGAKALRAAGRIPAVVYGQQVTPQNIEVNAKEMEDLIHHSVSENLLVDLTIKDDARPKRLALVQEVQHYALTGKVLHVDFRSERPDPPFGLRESPGGPHHQGRCPAQATGAGAGSSALCPHRQSVACRFPRGGRKR